MEALANVGTEDVPSSTWSGGKGGREGFVEEHDGYELEEGDKRGMRDPSYLSMIL
jgi:hypothetical protein